MKLDFHRLRVTEVRRETADAVSIRLEAPPHLQEAFSFRAGQHLTLRRLDAGEDIRRNYSLCAAPSEGALRIGVKKVPGGAFSTWANEVLQPGDEIEAMAPHGSFTWAFKRASKRTYVAFAGGSGITPVLSLAKTALEQEPNSQFSLFYGNRDSRNIMFSEELAALKDRYTARLALQHFLEDEEEEFAVCNGPLDRVKCEEILSSFIDAAAVDAFFICGPGPMMEAAEETLRAHGVPPEKILVERFTTGPATEAQAANARALEERAAGLKMRVILGGRRTQLIFDPALHSILDNVRAAGLPAPFACKGGVCATCRAKVTSGKVEMKVNYGLSAVEIAEGYVLTCQAAPLSEDVAISYDA